LHLRCKCRCGHDGLVLAQARFEAGQLSLPVRMDAAGGVRRFHHGGTDVTAASLGDPAAAVRQATIVYPIAQAGITHQVIGGGKARDIADGGQHGDGRDQADAG
jgi:hypothetical protein